jgi:hypothetical protein
MHKKYLEFRGPPELMKIHDEMMEDLLKNGTIQETTFKELTWINPTHLVPKPNGKWRLVVDMRQVNRFMKPRHFKMDGTPTLKEL